MINNQIHILAGGSSSVGGFCWYFVGLNYKEICVVTSDYEYSKDDRVGWIVREYSPGQMQDEWKVLKGVIAEKIIDACKNQLCPKNIEWSDRIKIRELYWGYKK